MEVGIGQMFVTMNPEAFGPSPRAAEIADEVVASLHAAKPVKEGGKVRYPGEHVLRVREENDRLGLPVERRRGRRYWRCDGGGHGRPADAVGYPPHPDATLQGNWFDSTLTGHLSLQVHGGIEVICRIFSTKELVEALCPRLSTSTASCFSESAGPGINSEAIVRSCCLIICKLGSIQ